MLDKKIEALLARIVLLEKDNRDLHKKFNRLKRGYDNLDTSTNELYMDSLKLIGSLDREISRVRDTYVKNYPLIKEFRKLEQIFKTRYNKGGGDKDEQGTVHKSN